MRLIQILSASFLPLKSTDISGSHPGSIGCILAETFISPAPPLILRISESRCKSPLNTAGAHFFCRRPADFYKQFFVSGRPQTDIVGKNSGAIYVIVSVHGIYAVKQRNPQTAVKRRLFQFINSALPVQNAVARRRRRTAAA